MAGKPPDYAKEVHRGQVWIAAYAAAWVAEFNATRDVAESVPHHQRRAASNGGKSGFDLALDTTAEAACTIADAAVAQLDDWVNNGR